MSGSGPADSNPDGSSSHLGDQLKQQVSQTSERAKEKLGTTAERFSERARMFSEQQKVTRTEQAQDVASAVHAAARQMESQMPDVATFVHKTADQLSTFASKLSNRSVDDIWRDVQDFARREPVMFFGGALALGFALSRFLKSSEDRAAEEPRSYGGTRTTQGPQTYGGSGYGGGSDGI